MTSSKRKILLVEHGNSVKAYAIAAARKLGLDVYVASNLYSQELVDAIGEENFFVSDTFDSHTLLIDTLRFMQRQNLVFDVITTFRENCVIPTADLADAFGLRGTSPHGARRSSQNKALMRHYLSQAGFNYQPKYLLLNLNDSDAAEQYAGFPKPCVAKPLFGTASHGVIYCDSMSFDELCDHMRSEVVPLAREIFSKFDGSILLEEYRPGKLISVDGVVCEKVFYPIGTLEFVMGNLPYFTQTASFMPARLSDRQSQAARDATTEAVRLLGFENSGVHAEFRVEGDQLTLVEIAARLPGATIHETYEKVYGSDLVQTLLSVLLEGMAPEFGLKKVVAYHHLLFPEIEQTSSLISFHMPSALMSETTDFLQLAEVDSILKTYPHNPTPVAGYLLTGSTYTEVIDKAKLLDKEIEIVTETIENTV